MNYFRVVISIIFILKNAYIVHNESVYYKRNNLKSLYSGYDNYTITLTDVNKYLDSLTDIVAIIRDSANNTEFDDVLGLFFTNGVLKNTLQYAGYKFHLLNQHQRRSLIETIKITDFILDSFQSVSNSKTTKLVSVSKSDKYRLSLLLNDRETGLFAHSLGDYNAYKTQRILTQRNTLDQKTNLTLLDRAEYLKFAMDININFRTDSNLDYCLSGVQFNTEPSVKDVTLQPCRRDHFCKKKVFSTSSMANSLIQRLAIMTMSRYLRRCYWLSPQQDRIQISKICGKMYDEAVYIAKRGFFARELFLKHVSICSMLGYEDFYHHHWFNKAFSWINKIGCVQETRNFIINKTRMYMTYTASEKIKNQLRTNLQIVLKNKCHFGPMSYIALYLANGIRHAMHFY